jgi:hypothetical protein
MKLYVVTKKAEEKNSSGIIQRVDSIIHGIFTTESFADAIAAKYDGTVTEFDADHESRTVVEQWLNPGYLVNT